MTFVPLRPVRYLCNPKLLWIRNRPRQVKRQWRSYVQAEPYEFLLRYRRQYRVGRTLSQ